MSGSIDYNVSAEDRKKALAFHEEHYNSVKNWPVCRCGTPMVILLQPAPYYLEGAGLVMPSRYFKCALRRWWNSWQHDREGQR